jgi:hypothetical protein
MNFCLGNCRSTNMAWPDCAQPAFSSIGLDIGAVCPRRQDRESWQRPPGPKSQTQ